MSRHRNPNSHPSPRPITSVSRPRSNPSVPPVSPLIHPNLRIATIDSVIREATQSVSLAQGENTQETPPTKPPSPRDNAEKTERPTAASQGTVQPKAKSQKASGEAQGEAESHLLGSNQGAKEVQADPEPHRRPTTSSRRTYDVSPAEPTSIPEPPPNRLNRIQEPSRASLALGNSRSPTPDFQARRPPGFRRATRDRPAKNRARFPMRTAPRPAPIRAVVPRKRTPRLPRTQNRHRHAKNPQAQARSVRPRPGDKGRGPAPLGRSDEPGRPPWIKTRRQRRPQQRRQRSRSRSRGYGRVPGQDRSDNGASSLGNGSWEKTLRQPHPRKRKPRAGMDSQVWRPPNAHPNKPEPPSVGPPTLDNRSITTHNQASAPPSGSAFGAGQSRGPPGGEGVTDNRPPTREDQDMSHPPTGEPVREDRSMPTPPASSPSRARRRQSPPATCRGTGRSL